MKYVAFSSAGEPIRVGSCPDGEVEQQARDGETALEWPIENGAPKGWRLVDGELVKP